MSDADVDSKFFNNDDTLEGGQEVYTNGINELNKICKVYGKGKGATGARSITVEDVDRVTGYDKTTYECTLGTYKIKYGESITYYWDTTTANRNKPYYETGRGLTGNLITHSKFVYHDGTTWKENTLPTTLPTERQKICTLIQTGYGYDVDEETTLKSTEEAYKMLFGSSMGKDYWLASSCVNVTSGLAGFALWTCDGFHSYVGSFNFVISQGDYGNPDEFGMGSGVRAVVTLAPNVSLDGTATSGYEII